MTTQSQLFATRIESLVPQHGGNGNLVNELYTKLDRLGVQLIKTQKQAAQAESDRLAMMEQNRELNSRLASQADLISGMLGKLREYEREKQASGSIPAEMWRRMVQLCHPDKHGNSEAANKATQWLNKIRP